MKKNQKQRIIVILNFLVEDIPHKEVIDVQGVQFTIITHSIGWNFKAAATLIKQFDGYADAIAINGLVTRVQAGKKVAYHRATRDLMRMVQTSPLYTGVELRKIFADWTLKQVLKKEPQFFNAKKVLFHFAVSSPFLQNIADAGANVICADALVMAGLPFKIKSLERLGTLLQWLKPIISNWHPKSRPLITKKDYNSMNRLRSWIKASDMFVSFGSLLDQIGSFDVLKGKTLVVDFIPPKLKDKLKASGVSRILEISPDIPGIKVQKFKSFSAMQAIVDQLRITQDSQDSFNDYIMNLIGKYEVKPKKVENLGLSFQRFAFVIHPLSRKDIFRNPKLKWIESTPQKVQNLAESCVAYLPAISHGTISGIKSKATGQEILCELYAIPATPKRMLAMKEEFIYKRLVDVAKTAHLSGCSMMGLGAYTKVVGDSGITVANRSPIPVTNGNSYSASATLWAARAMVDRLGFVSRKINDRRIRGKAAVIGATGSIGKVSTMLLATVYDELLLVATRPDRLLELKQEILEKYPGTKVQIKTKVIDELRDVDLVVTATSAQNEKVLDMDLLKPGAVVCDCSRPLDVGPEDARRRPDVMVIESGEIDLPGLLNFSCDIGLPGKSVYACLAETALLTLESRFENFSLGRDLQIEQVKEIYKLGIKHGASLSAIQGPLGVITESDVENCRKHVKQLIPQT